MLPESPPFAQHPGSATMFPEGPRPSWGGLRTGEGKRKPIQTHTHDTYAALDRAGQACWHGLLAASAGQV